MDVAHISGHGLEYTMRVAGELSKAEVVRELAAADALIILSLETVTWPETQVCVVQEAVLMKMLDVATSAGGVPESIAPEMSRFLVQPNNATAIADTIRQIGNISETEMQVLGEKGKHSFISHYSIEKVNDKLSG